MIKKPFVVTLAVLLTLSLLGYYARAVSPSVVHLVSPESEQVGHYGEPLDELAEELLRFLRDGSRTIPPSVVYLVPPEPEQVEYIAKPRDVLAKYLFSFTASRQSKEANWSNAVGRWVVWYGEVDAIEPRFNPNRIYFRHRYETPPLSIDSGRFGITVEFDPAWTSLLEQLSPGQTVYYRARLATRGAGFGLSSGFLRLKDGQIIDRSDIAAKLVNLAHTSEQKLDELMEKAKSIAKVNDFFRQRLEPRWKKARIVVKALPMPITIPEKPGVACQHMLAHIIEIKIKSKAEIRANLEDALIYLHPGTTQPAKEHHLRQFIQQKSKANRESISEIRENTQLLMEIYEEARQRPGLEDILKALAGQLPVIGEFMSLTLPYDIFELYQSVKEAERVTIYSYYLLMRISEHIKEIAKWE
ncbi:hypothetical protein M1N42_03160 [Thermodesulfovibrionales bacterium]|nr:hypothetical protein [Thermodesulfovibrionales bacterium]MCL0068728.1 hypothetical protein [Thermodesulfovibrionales bacterium]MCL0071448.1 hypothetical protein [Thermodesulfovibrionales bacterium]